MPKLADSYLVPSLDVETFIRVMSRLTIPIIAAGVCLFGPRLTFSAEFAADRSAALFARLDANGDGLLSATEVPANHAQLYARLLRKADRDESGTLTETEFAHGITPSRPAKPLVEKQTGDLPGANEMRLLLLMLDANRDTFIDQNEVPPELLDVFDQLVEAADRNGDDRLSRMEISGAAPRISRLARREMRTRQIDVAAELQRLEESQGMLAGRFESAAGSITNLSNPAQVRELFSQLDANQDGQLELAEIPIRIRQRLKRLFARIDRDGTESLSEREFLRAAERLAQISQIFNETQRDSRPRVQPSVTDAPTRSAVRQILRRLDADGNGAISRDEARGPLAARFQDLDSDENGAIEIVELRRRFELIRALQQNRD